jgi:methylmalonyl-CoA/ethylmalonyl-CoA epimerase
MELKFSHVDVRVKNLEETCAYYAQILKARIKKRSLIPTDKLAAGVAL